MYNILPNRNKKKRINMEAPRHNFLETCLFFNTNAFSRQLLKLAEVEFKPLKLSPAHASLLLLVFDAPGIGPKELSRLLCLTPSTITRFIDSLAKKNWSCAKPRVNPFLFFPPQKVWICRQRLPRPINVCICAIPKFWGQHLPWTFPIGFQRPMNG